MRWKQTIRPDRRHEWQRWFAWHPVNVTGFNAYPGTFVWLAIVERRREPETCWGGGERWEYRALTPSGHTRDCEWHCEQVSRECTCGLIPSLQPQT